MSDNFLIFIPTDPQFLPDSDSRSHALHYLEDRFPDADECRQTIHDAIEFVDCGANFQSVHCPACEAVLDTHWWQEAMGTAQQTAYLERAIKTPCCGHQTDLNELDYRWPMGFARFELHVLNPGRKVEEHETKFLEAELDTPLRVIYSHI